MTEEAVTSEEDFACRDRRMISGALCDDVTRAVDIISVRKAVSGALAYRMLATFAADSGMNVRKTARCIVEARGAPRSFAARASTSPP